MFFALRSVIDSPSHNHVLVHILEFQLGNTGFDGGPHSIAVNRRSRAEPICIYDY